MAGSIKRNRQRSFVRLYGARHPRVKKLAALAGAYIKSLLADLHLDVHLVSSRAKSVTSVHEKIVRKSYGNPARQLRDAVGVRVITYYAHDIDRVVSKLRTEMEVDERNSIDKRHALGVREFGYRSVQLVGRVSQRGLDRLKFSALKGLWFEIQVRSILEHEWAEIEHEIVYKAGIKYPRSVLRRFASIAGNLEILEREFRALKKARSRLIEKYRAGYQSNHERRLPFDAARLLGYLEARQPAGLSWRKAEQKGKPFPPKIDATCTKALDEIGLDTPDKLDRFIRRKDFRQALRSFAASQGVLPRDVSHLALIQIVVALKDQDAFADYFPEFIDYLPLLQPARRRRY